ncbi:unnamed protein product, partial [Discosporangium mesarthrocarpum]
MDFQDQDPNRRSNPKFQDQLGTKSCSSSPGGTGEKHPLVKHAALPPGWNHRTLGNRRAAWGPGAALGRAKEATTPVKARLLYSRSALTLPTEISCSPGVAAPRSVRIHPTSPAALHSAAVEQAGTLG